MIEIQIMHLIKFLKWAFVLGSLGSCFLGYWLQALCLLKQVSYYLSWAYILGLFKKWPSHLVCRLMFLLGLAQVCYTVLSLKDSHLVPRPPSPFLTIQSPYNISRLSFIFYLSNLVGDSDLLCASTQFKLVDLFLVYWLMCSIWMALLLVYCLVFLIF